MALELQDTVLNQSPFWDDYDESDNYHRVLFRPGVAVQARELTQLQTILQDQIARFGENIFKTGTVIKGCAQSFDSNYSYVKILDNQLDGQPCNMSLYANTLIIGSANLRAYVVNTVPGLQTQDPDLNTLYLKYINTGTGGEKTFAAGATITSFHRDRRVESVQVVLGGSGYSNTDVVTFTAAGTGGAGAVGTVVTFANGTIREVILNEKGAGYVDVPGVSVTSTNGTGAQLLASVDIAELSIANTSFTEPTGTGYAVNVSDGIIFQKGHFVRFDGGTAIVSKYTTSPNNAVVGFTTLESIANSSNDPSLLDNAAGSLNYRAPGAYRLKLTPELVVKTKEEAAANATFFSIVEFEAGKKVRQSEGTQYNVIGDQIAKRTYEESGNYVVSRFPISTESITGNTTHINAAVGTGIAYVEGHRVENLDNIRVPMRKATDTITDAAQSITTNYGSYFFVKEMAGSFNGSVGSSVSLRSAAGSNLTNNLGGTPTAPGAQIGTARIRAVQYDSGDVGTPSCVYKVYIFDVVIASGHTISEVRALSVNDTACADVVLQAGAAILYETDFSSLVFSTGTYAISELNSENFIYRGQVSGTGIFNTSGVATITLSGAEEFPYTPSSTLNDTQERDFVIIPTNSTFGGTKTGNVQTFGNTTVQANTGSTTAFLTEYNVGESIRIGSNNFLIVRIISNTRLEVASNVEAGTSQAHRIAFPAYVPVRMSGRPGASIAIDSTGQIATITLGSTVGTLNAAMNASIHFNSKVVGENIVGATQITKSITKGVYVKISGSQLASLPNGPWSLGHADVHRLTKVYRGSGSTYAATNDVTSSFTMSNGQTDDMYALATLGKKVGAVLNLTGDDNLLVEMEVYTRNSGYYMSAESYPVDDSTSPLPATKIRTEEIEVHISPYTGRVYDLRDSLDFRPAVSNTAVLATTIAGATVDPSAVNTLSGGIIYFPAPNAIFTADVTSYMGRIDRIILDSKGQIRVAEGTPSNAPTAPVEPLGVMTLGLARIPPYPTLPSVEARAANRPDLAVNVSLVQQRRYTMRDIQDIETRIARLEYYSLLNSLEQDTRNLVIPSDLDATIDRFKNGFFVDPFDNYDIANVTDPEYKMFIDVFNSEARPVVVQRNVELEYRSDLNDDTSSYAGDTVILNYDEVELISQPYATRVRNCMELAYSYKGRLQTYPAYDNHYDTNVTPQSIDIDIAGAIQPLISSINEGFRTVGGRVTINNTTANERLIGTSATRVAGGTNTTNTFEVALTSTGTETRVRGIEATYGDRTSVIGDYVTNFALNPYIRAQVIRVAAVGLRPGAQHYPFFDQKPVSVYCQPAAVDVSSTVNEESFYPAGSIGDPIFADEYGVVAFLFYVPAGMFMVGERELLVLDTSSLDSQSAAVSRATGQFNAYNFSVDKQELSLNTKTVNSVRVTTQTVPYVSTTRGTINRVSFTEDVHMDDPVAQTFRVQSPNPGTDGVLITSIDLFFQRKDPVQGVIVEIRETAWGSPAPTVLPYGRARMPSDLVVTSPDASQPTKFTFESPVYLKADVEYAFAVYPEAGSPEYLIWTGETGGTDVEQSGLVKKSDWGAGVMFLSSNGRVWSPMQFEDVKFVLRRASFTETSSTVTLAPKAYEFLTVQGQSGLFTPGELVAQRAVTYGPGVVYANTSSRTITGSNTGFTTNVSVGDRLLLTYGTSRTTAKTGTVSGGAASGVITGTSTDFVTEYAVGDFIQFGNSVREILSIANTTSMTVDGAPREEVSGVAHYGVTPRYTVAKVTGINTATSIVLDTVPPLSSVSGSGIVANYQKVVSAVVDYFDASENKLMLKSSTAANSTFKFEGSRVIIGGTSQAQAQIVTVDNINVSYVEPHVQTFVPPATSTSFNVSVTRAANNQSVVIAGEYGVTNRVPFPATLKSRSNEISGVSFTDSMRLIQNMSTVANNLSPIVDVNPGSVVIIENIVDNYVDSARSANTFSNTLVQTNTSVLVAGMSVGGLGIPEGTIITGIDGSNVTLSAAASHTLDETTLIFTANEHKQFGVSKNRYISKRLALEEGLDAEDVKVIMTAYKPEGTEIEVYAKILNGADSETFTNKDWSKLIQTTKLGVNSDTLNPQSFVEYEYSFDTTPPNVRVTGTVRTDVSANTANVMVEGFGSEFNSELVVGDFVKLVRNTDESRFDIRRVATITDFDSITLSEAPSFTDDGIKMYKITQPLFAYKNSDNDGVVRYYNSSGSYFDTYKYMALKIVLRATNSAVVPRVQDIRALALSV